MASHPTPAQRVLLGYARESRDSRGPDIAAQMDQLSAAGIDSRRIYSDTAASGGTDHARPGLAALLDYARAGDAVVVVGIDRLGRTITEALRTARTIFERDLALRSLREGIDTDTETGSMIVGVLCSLAMADDESTSIRPGSTGAHRSAAIGRPRALNSQQIALAERMRDGGDAVPAIARALGVSRATLYRTFAERRTNS